MALPLEEIERIVQQSAPRDVPNELRKQALSTDLTVSKFYYGAAVFALILGGGLTLMMFPWVAIFGVDLLPGVDGLPKEDPKMAIAGLFACIGPIFFVVTWFKRRRIVKLLRQGVFTEGVVQSVDDNFSEAVDELRNLAAGKFPVNVTVSFHADGEERVHTYQAIGPELEMARKKAKNGEPVGLLYDPDKPYKCIRTRSLI